MPRIITLAHYYSPYEAQIVASCLMAHEIYAVVPEWHHGTQAWHHVVALNGIRVCICDTDLEEATHLITETQNHQSRDLDPARLYDSNQPLAHRLLSVAIWWWSGIPTPYWRRLGTRG